MFEYQLQATSCCSSSFESVLYLEKMWFVCTQQQTAAQHQDCCKSGHLRHQQALLSQQAGHWQGYRQSLGQRAFSCSWYQRGGMHRDCAASLTHSWAPAGAPPNSLAGHCLLRFWCLLCVLLLYQQLSWKHASCSMAIAARSAPRLQLEYLIGNCMFSVTGPHWRWYCGDSQRDGVADVRPTYCGRNRGFHGRRPRQRQVIWLLVQPKGVSFRWCWMSHADQSSFWFNTAAYKITSNSS